MKNIDKNKHFITTHASSLSWMNHCLPRNHGNSLLLRQSVAQIFTRELKTFLKRLILEHIYKLQNINCEKYIQKSLR